MFSIFATLNVAYSGELPDEVKALYKTLPDKIEAKKLSDSYVMALSRNNYEEAFKLFVQSSTLVSKENFIASSKGAEKRFGPWKDYDYVNPSAQEVKDPQTGESQYLPGYLYKISLENYRTKLFLMILMDQNLDKPRIIANIYTPENTVSQEKRYDMR